MQHAALVGGGEATEQVGRQALDLVDRERSVAELVGEAAAVEGFEDQERGPVVGVLEVEDGDDPRIVDPRCSPCLPLDAVGVFL